MFSQFIISLLIFLWCCFDVAVLNFNVMKKKKRSSPLERQWSGAFSPHITGEHQLLNGEERAAGPQSGAPDSQPAVSLGQIVLAALCSPQVGPYIPQPAEMVGSFPC